MLMISMGTRSDKKPIPYRKAKDFGSMNWIRPLIDIMMSANSETVSHQFEWLFDARNNREGFIRLESVIRDANFDMANALKNNMEAFEKSRPTICPKQSEKN